MILERNKRPPSVFWIWARLMLPPLLAGVVGGVVAYAWLVWR